MSTDLVVSIIADDKPGLIDSLAQTVVDNQGNWLESRMAQMAGKFAGILRISVSEAHTSALTDALMALEAQGIKVIVEGASAAAAAASRTLLLNLVGNDRPGIIREVSQTLAQQQVNVEELTTECSPAPHTSDLLFRAQARLQVPVAVDIDTLISTLESLADDLIVEVTHP
ncbi:glycine cleavage system protein R [Aestuariirhabdus sp. Z084]|uniref:glycine cleavage system protein R n=1 Tax=Aestuariirhabdus haliotis TaxID=2918751 RepID=UPI00201B3675|nr:ACT domain-containing protein [Aestuariirhabdus haliotis]MCL6415135.1 glycine cleavage system protein R [Aestuariirhabdus haliotis]MCL6419067.1 glycine cleavage system protein R [Aestuariirhabdus haliotis]